MSEIDPPRILVADDREQNRYVLCRVLAGAGYECTEAATGAAAIALAASQPDIIILDVRLPDISGYDVCQRIKSNPDTAAIPILQISASFIATEDRVRALEAGADAYLTHPIDRMVLVATVRALLRLHIAETAARKSAREWEAAFDALSEGLAVVDADNRMVRWNAAFAAICGAEFVPERGKSPFAFFGRLAGKGQFGNRQERSTAEFQIQNRTVQLSVNSMDGDGGRRDRILVLYDITDRKLAEYALRTAEKLAATGKLANAIAHEINNPLEAITNLVFLARASEDLDFIQSLLSKANVELDRIARIAKQTLAFHRDTQLPVPINLEELLSNVIALYEAPCAIKRVRLEFDSQPTPLIYGFPGQLTQVFGNLIRNASEAAPSHSRVIIRVRPVGHGTGARITIHDSGPGIPQRIRERIFDPFFTTKDLKGSGLGLWVSKRIIAKHNGIIRFRSSEREGKCGTTFGVFLPTNEMIAELSA